MHDSQVRIFDSTTYPSGILSCEAVSEQTTESLIAELVTEVIALREKQNEILAVMTQIMNAVEPTLEGLRKSALGKMMGI